ncbi:shikimate kinase [Paenibacillus humicola]|uniref:shikimate kinase n=1 Tax=Paenibacillus humicola TaxID=3110540 RepID=UPI00237B2C43|nr:shikimate kinase [Paenibacillus humicola]
MTLAKPHVVLVGFMGTGKSTVGKLLAERIGFRYIDADAEIVRREGRDIPAIFSESGEAAFRAAETGALEAIFARDEPSVVATGGGAVLLPRNRELMLRHGFVAALTADPERIISRVKEDASRPLLQGDLRERVYRLLEERKTAYDFAHLTIDTTLLDALQVAEKIEQNLHRER